jgi:hypothetical protein
MKKIFAVVALGLALLCASCVTEASYTGNPAGKKIAIIGDGITYSGINELHAVLDPSFQVRIAANGNKTIAQMQTIATDYATSNPDAIVLNLGTYDVLTGVPLPTIGSELATLMAKFPNACVVLTTLNTNVSAAGYSNASAATLNSYLAGADRIVEWDAYAAADLDANTVAPDHINITPVGASLLANITSGAVSGCFGGGE